MRRLHLLLSCIQKGLFKVSTCLLNNGDVSYRLMSTLVDNIKTNEDQARHCV